MRFHTQMSLAAFLAELEATMLAVSMIVPPREASH
jgi:hypothetical protein